MLNTFEGKNSILVSDVRAERLFREAEDDFFYFNKIEDATDKLQRALKYAPSMIKALLMRANIALIEGDVELALAFYHQAECFAPENAKVLAGLANIYEILDENDVAYEYIQKALFNLSSNDCQLKKALVDLEFTILIKQKKYSMAQKILDDAKFLFEEEDYKVFQANNISVLKQKLEVQKRLKQTKLRLVK